MVPPERLTIEADFSTHDALRPSIAENPRHAPTRAEAPDGWGFFAAAVGGVDGRGRGVCPEKRRPDGEVAVASPAGDPARDAAERQRGT